MDIKFLIFCILAVVYGTVATHNSGNDASCAKRCSQVDFDKDYQCQCNKDCSKRDDCCKDYGLQCLVEPWRKHGREELQKALKNQKVNNNLAKNVIVFIGDGMDVTTTTAARILKGQQKGNTGEEETMVYETFPHVGLSKTYTTDYQIGDSAGTGTAMFCGVKTKYHTVGVDDRIEFDVCETTETAKVDSVLVSAQEAGKSTGIITTARITHATPATLYAHSPNRDWEHEAGGDCEDIASQMLTYASKVNVIMGGGRLEFLQENTTDPEYGNVFGNRTDGRNLIDEWNALHNETRHQFVWNKTDMDSVNPETTDYLLGLFEPDHMQYENDRDPEKEPSITEMTIKALEILQRNENGFFLMVEGGRIDLAHHKGLAHLALQETVALDGAIDAALKMVDTQETLIIVTADHAHGMSMIGYTGRGNPIFGLNDKEIPIDGLPYTTLMYAFGPGGILELDNIDTTGHRRNLTYEETSDPYFVQPALVPTVEVNHAGQDVPIYAIGPMSHMFHSTHEQNYIAHVIRHASCMGEYTEDCSRYPTRKKNTGRKVRGTNQIKV